MYTMHWTLLFRLVGMHNMCTRSIRGHITSYRRPTKTRRALKVSVPPCQRGVGPVMCVLLHRLKSIILS